MLEAAPARAGSGNDAAAYRKLLADARRAVQADRNISAEGLDGKPYNVNADLAAGRVASALRARRLVYMSDVPGLLANPSDPDSLISTLKTGQVEELKRRGVIDKGMRPKVQSAVRALQEGVQRVHFIDGRLPHSLLLEMFTDRGIGTEIVQG